LKGEKVDDDSDENSEDINEESGEEEVTGVKAKKKEEEKKADDKGHKPILKTQEEVKKAQFLGEKYGHFKMGSYVRIEI
jgi:hypothetical protein